MSTSNDGEFWFWVTKGLEGIIRIMENHPRSEEPLPDDTIAKLEALKKRLEKIWHGIVR